ncbi:hypothetical protein O181_017940 [Austropuccinia psidii MF-1]|uniref:Uncharacterized protein n=1 Tax=Austropuccinia psidii MF-1 TaxID=1389203 RepID=A0A9Q3GTI6_9BASI|nr:hypothetical protein [Austropuccinia psidii MF-1]
MLMRLHHPQDVTPTLPPISELTTPYASTPQPLNMLMLMRHPQDMPLPPPSYWRNPQHHLPSLCSCSALKMTLQFCPHYSSCFRTTASSSLHTIPMLLRHPQDMPPMLPSTPLCLILSAAYHSYNNVLDS